MTIPQMCGRSSRTSRDVGEILETQDTTAAMPLIFLTTKSRTVNIQRAFSPGSCDYITKHPTGPSAQTSRKRFLTASRGPTK